MMEVDAQAEVLLDMVINRMSSHDEDVKFREK